MSPLPSPLGVILSSSPLCGVIQRVWQAPVLPKYVLLDAKVLPTANAEPEVSRELGYVGCKIPQ